jgi:ubiquinone/menaquinone biosynthesis C-methylase UbiE
VLVGLILLRPGFVVRARVWWTVALVIQFWHHIEHLLLLIQAQTHTFFFGGTVPTSVLQTVFPHVELHLFYNSIVFVPMVIAVYLHLRPGDRELAAAPCGCAGAHRQPRGRPAEELAVRVAAITHDVDMVIQRGFQLHGEGPEAYERYLVPTLFGPCAEQLLGLVPAEPGHRVLDVACGSGIVARRAAARVGARGSVVGVDVNQGMLDVARAVAADGPTAIEWFHADAAALPLRDQAFDIVYCQQGLQFFTDRPAALREMRRVLRPGGRVAFAAWRGLEHNAVFAALVAALERHAGSEAAGMMRAPFAGPDQSEIRRLMGDAGFDGTVIRIGAFAARFASVAQFLVEEVHSSPLVGPVGALDEGRYEALGQDLAEALTAYIDDNGGVLVPMQTWVVAAHRPA